MAEASDAGVNPMAPPVAAQVTETPPEADAGIGRWAVPGIGGVLVVAAIGWAGHRRRLRARS